MEIYRKIAQLKVMPVIAIEDRDSALPLADALLEGGLPIAEITFRTDAAAKAIETMKKQRPELLIGAGTILNKENLKKAQDSGAEFGLAPGFNREIVEEALKIGFPFSPGIMTPSEIEGAMSLGIKFLKFFPAEAAGGIKMLKSLIAPYAHTGLSFMPTGGLKLENIGQYLEVKQVIACGGSWIASKTAIAEKNWEAIKQNCLEINSLLHN